MADISKITLPSGTTYNIKDAQARDDIEAIKGAISGGVSFLGITTTVLTDGATTNPIVIDGKSVSAINGAVVIYGGDEFIWAESDTSWHKLGPAGEFKALAYKDSATGSFTPAGTVSQPTFTGSSSTVTITATDNTSGNYQPKGTVSKPTFTGSSSTFTGTFTPEGTVSKPTFTGASMTSTGKFTPEGGVSVSTSTTANKTATVSKASSGTVTYTPEGSVAAPTISVKTAGSTDTIKNPTSVTVAKTVVAAAPGATAPSNSITYYSVTDETLSLYQIGYTTGASITTSNVTVKTGDAAYEASAPAFTGTGVRLVTGNIPVPASYTATFTGTEGNVSVSGTTTGSVSQPTFTGTEEDISVSGTPNGSVSQPTFTGTKTQLSGTTTASGTVSQPTFTGTAGTVAVS